MATDTTAPAEALSGEELLSRLAEWLEVRRELESRAEAICLIEGAREMSDEEFDAVFRPREEAYDIAYQRHEAAWKGLCSLNPEDVRATLARAQAAEAERDRLLAGLEKLTAGWSELTGVGVCYAAEEVREVVRRAVSVEKEAQLQAVLDAPRWDELTPAERTDVIARQVASSLRLSGHETTPEQIKAHLNSAEGGR